MAQEHEGVSRPQPSPMVEYRGIAYSLGTIISKLRREGVPLPQADPQAEASHLSERPTLGMVMHEGPCVCCSTTTPDWPKGSDWPWVYFMGACLCITCYRALCDASVRPLSWQRTVGDVQTVRDGVRIAPEPDDEPFGYEEIVRLVGRPVSPQEVVWANLGALTAWGRPLGDVIEDLWAAGKLLTLAEFERLVERGKAA
jgi:hypothetical protein